MTDGIFDFKIPEQNRAWEDSIDNSISGEFTTNRYNYLYLTAILSGFFQKPV